MCYILLKTINSKAEQSSKSLQAQRLSHHHIQTRPGACLTSYVNSKTGSYLKQLQQGHSPDLVCMELCLCPLLV